MSDPNAPTQPPPALPELLPIHTSLTVPLEGPDQWDVYFRLREEAKAIMERAEAALEAALEQSHSRDRRSVEYSQRPDVVRVHTGCERCGGSGFTGMGRGYDDVCDDCAGGPTWIEEATIRLTRDGEVYVGVLDVGGGEKVVLSTSDSFKFGDDRVEWLTGLIARLTAQRDKLAAERAPGAF